MSIKIDEVTMKETRLKKIRILAGYSQSEVSRTTGIHFSTISRIETGLIKPNNRHKKALARFFNLESDLLFPNKEKPSLKQ